MFIHSHSQAKSVTRGVPLSSGACMHAVEWKEETAQGGLDTRVGQTPALSSVLMPAATEEGLCSNSDYVFIGVVSDFYR